MEKIANTSPLSNAERKKVEKQIDDFDKKSQNYEKNKKTVSRLVSCALGLALLAFVIFLIVRIVQSDHKALDGLFITEEFKDAYSVSDEVFTHDTENAFVASGEGSVLPYSFVYIPKAGYAQLTVRYNKNQLNDVKNACPNFSEDFIHFTLSASFKNIETEETTNIITYTPNVVATEEKYNYKYFKIEFPGVDFTADYLTINMIFDNVEKVVPDDGSATYLRDMPGAKFIAGDVQIHDQYNIKINSETNEKYREEKQYAPYYLSDYEKGQLN